MYHGKALIVVENFQKHIKTDSFKIKYKSNLLKIWLNRFILND